MKIRFLTPPPLHVKAVGREYIVRIIEVRNGHPAQSPTTFVISGCEKTGAIPAERELILSEIFPTPADAERGWAEGFKVDLARCELGSETFDLIKHILQQVQFAFAN